MLVALNDIAIVGASCGCAVLLYAGLIGTFGGLFLEVFVIQRFGVMVLIIDGATISTRSETEPLVEPI